MLLPHLRGEHGAVQMTTVGLHIATHHHLVVAYATRKSGSATTFPGLSWSRTAPANPSHVITVPNSVVIISNVIVVDLAGDVGQVGSGVGTTR